MDIAKHNIGDWVVVDGSYIYQVIGIRYVTDRLVLGRLRSRVSEDGEEFLLLKKHSKYRGAWAQFEITIVRSEYCRPIDKIAEKYIIKCNEDIDKYIKYRRFDTIECNDVTRLTYKAENLEWRENALVVLNAGLRELPAYFTGRELQAQLANKIGLDIYKPMKYGYTTAIGIELILFSHFMHTDKNGNVLFTHLKVLPLDR